jgi:acyl-CoA reductase-like NAD-dependent aldehyde dehydrogenase
MIAPNQGASTPAVDAVLGALERLTDDLRRRTEEAERRAEAAEKRAELEGEARRDAERRAALAEQGAQNALRRAEAIEAAAKESVEQLRRDLLDAIREAVDVAKATAATIEAAIEPDHPPDDQQDTSPQAGRNRDLPYIPEPATGRMSTSQPAPRRWEKGERGYAWVEDEPGPPWWRRLFGRHH